MNKRYPYSGAVSKMRDERQAAIDGAGAAIGGNGAYATEAAARHFRTQDALEKAHIEGYREGFKVAEDQARQRAAFEEDRETRKHDSDCQNVTAASEAGPAPCTCGLNMYTNAAAPHAGLNMTTGAGEAEPGPAYVTNLEAFTGATRAAGTLLFCGCGRNFLDLVASNQPTFIDEAKNAYCANCRPVYAIVGGWAELSDFDGSETQAIGVTLMLRPIEPGEDESHAQAKAYMNSYRIFASAERATKQAVASAREARFALLAVQQALRDGADRGAIEELTQYGLKGSFSPSDDGARRLMMLVTLSAASAALAHVHPANGYTYSEEFIRGFHAAVDKCRHMLRALVDK